MIFHSHDRKHALQAEAKKAEGNKAFAKKKYQMAIGVYSEAISLNASNHVYYSNRSACYAEAGKFGEAKADGEMCIKVNPGFVKGYLRKANAEFLMGDLDAAVATIREGLKKDAKFSELTKLHLMVSNIPIYAFQESFLFGQDPPITKHQ